MKALIESLVKFQLNVPAIPKNKVNPHYKSKFADLTSIIEICSPVLNNNDLVVVQTFSVVDQSNTLVTHILHKSGESLSSTIYLPDISDPQKLTAAITYLRRTAYLSICGLVADDDDDGNAASDKSWSNNQASQRLNTNQASDQSVVPASEPQKNAMRKMGIQFKETISKADASKMIEAYNKGK